jgi:pimeloyl-ACP methyl ester carboxylesterase
MQRRRFVVMSSSAVAAGALGYALPGTRGQVPAARPSPMDVAAFHASRRFASTPFGRIAYVERGAGPAALFLHGLPLNGFQWRGALDRLAPYRRCVAPDFMGLGYSEIPAGQSVAPEAQARMLLALLDSLGIADTDLVASDSGGAVAQIIVARWPERVRTLLLTNCDVHEDSPPPAVVPVIEAARAGTFVDENLAPQLEDRARSLLPTGLAGCCYTRPTELAAETLECYLAPLASSPLRKQQLHDYCIALAENPLVALEPALRRSTVPLRVVWGTGDTIFSPASPDWLDRTFPHSRGVRRIEGANLFFPEEMPEIIAAEAQALWGLG